MARDPFAPVTQSSIPPWIWIIAGTFAVLLIGAGATVFVVLSRRPPPVVATPSADKDKAPSGPAKTVSMAAVPTTDKAPPRASAAPGDGADKGAAADKQADGDGDKEHHRGHHRGHTRGQVAGNSAVASPAAAGQAVAPPKPPKKKIDMSQKEIDNLLGI